MKPSPYWRRWLTKQRMYCGYCYGEGQRTRLGGPEILSVDGVTMEKFGTPRYNRILRTNTIKHLREAHGITR